MFEEFFDFDYKYLTQDQLAGFEKYKYACVDTSPLSIYVMHPFWNHVVEFCPRWLAPNLLTFVGFLFTVAATALLSYYDFHYFASSGLPGSESIPLWVFLAVSVLIFVAYTLDGIDGKQARRTGTCGPLGELFDHGLDSWTAILIPVCLYSVFGRSEFSVPPIRYYAVCWNVFLTFYTTHWEKYNTGVLFLPWGYDLSMLATTTVFAVTYLVGDGLWKISFANSISTGHILEIVFYMTSLCATLPVSIYNIISAYKTGSGKGLSMAESFRPLVPVFGHLFITVLWTVMSPSNIVNRHPRALYLMTGTVFSNITCRLVVSQMSGSRCDLWNWLVSLELLITLFALSLPSLEVTLLYALWLLSTYAHIHYGSCVMYPLKRL